MAERELWAAVVLLALDDVAEEAYGSVDYDHAAAFFTGAGDWAKSRQEIADMLDLHADDLARLGRRAICKRHLRDGGPPLPEPVVRRDVGRTVRLVSVVADPPPPVAAISLESTPVKRANRRNSDPSQSRGEWVRTFINSGYRRIA